MKTIVKIGSCCTALILVIVTFASVVGYQTVQSTGKNLSSPLFTIRTQLAIKETSEKSMTSKYLGKGKTLYLFTSSRSMLRTQIDKAITMINTNPALIQKLIERISKSPQMLYFSHQHGLNMAVIKRTLTQIKDNPEILKNQLIVFNDPDANGDDSQPLGLDTSSALGCFITALVLLPLAIVIGVLIATIMIITCFNIGNCFETIVQAILAGMLQKLNQP